MHAAHKGLRLERSEQRSRHTRHAFDATYSHSARSTAGVHDFMITHENPLVHHAGTVPISGSPTLLAHPSADTYLMAKNNSAATLREVTMCNAGAQRLVRARRS